MISLCEPETSSALRLLEKAIGIQLRTRWSEDPTRIPLSKPQADFHRAQEPERILAGGNGSGKTFCGAREARLFAEGRHPFRDDVQAPNAGWIVSPTFNMSQEIIEPYLGIRHDPHITPIFPPAYGEWKAARRVLVLPNGSSIGLMSCDAGALRFQGPKRRWVMFDEEPPLDVYQEAGARLVPGHRLDRWICMTPTQGLTWTYDDFVLKPKPGRHRIVYADLSSNPAVTKQQLEDASARYDRDVLKVARMTGRFTAVGLRPAFPIQPLERWLELSVDYPGRVGYLSESMKFVDHEGGELTVWEEPKPGVSYVSGDDVAEGIKDGAYSVVEVFRAPDREQVAEWRGHIAPIPFGRVIARLNRWYNDAFTVPEANNHGHATIAELVTDCEYRNVYQRQSTDRDAELGKYNGAWGFFTTRQNKNLLEQLLYEAIASGRITLRSPVLIRELMGASRDILGEMIGGRGLFTDCIMAAGLALIGMRDRRYLGWPEAELEENSIEWVRQKLAEARETKEKYDLVTEWSA